MSLRDFDERMLRLKLALGVSKDMHVASELGLSKAALSNRKQRGVFPISDLFALKERLSDLDCVFILTGRKLGPLPEFLQLAFRLLAEGTHDNADALMQFVDYIDRTQQSLHH